MTTSNPSLGPTHDDEEDIQGNLVGFNKDNLRLLFVTFPTADAGKQFLAGMAKQVNHAAEIKSFNERFKERGRAGRSQLSEQASWVNLVLSFRGLETVGADGLDAFPDSFKQGMRARAQLIGDVDQSDPANWTGPFAPNSGFAVHAMVIIAADTPTPQDPITLLDERTTEIRALIQSSGVTEFGATQEGHTRPAPFTGHEHFGFKDGISQPGIRGLTTASKPGSDTIAAGEFLIGYEDQDRHISGQPVETPPAPGQPGYPPTASPTQRPIPPWCRNGSFAVYRKLFQNVGGFRQFTDAHAGEGGLTADQLRAKMVGRWPSGAPLENVPGDGHIDPTAQDAGAADPNSPVLDDAHINNFGYQQHDADGHLMPKAAHVRKANPRDGQPAGKDESNRHRIARRGITYGPEFVEGEVPYGGGPVPEDDRDRGLLFICYQSSIERGFEFIQTQWANKPDFPDADSGQDPIISQNVANPPFTIPPNVHLVTERWVITTGGEYFFSPSISALRHLAGETAQ
jgi:Dyp-type peroxidase family